MRNFSDLARERAEALELLKEGVPVSEIVNRFGHSLSWVKSICYVNNIELPKPNIKYNQNSNYQVIADLINTELSFSEIGRLRGVSRERVRQIAGSLREHNIRIPERG